MGLRGWVVGLLMATIALCAIVADGCGGGSGDDSTSPDEARVLAEGGILASRPEITGRAGLPPKKIVIREMQKGTGVEAQKGDKVQIQYYGAQWRGGSEHSNSWRYGHIPVFEVGSHRLLHGLNVAIRGMKEGGSREVIIPANLVYYPGAPHPHLSRLDALIYKVYLVEVFKKNGRE